MRRLVLIVLIVVISLGFLSPVPVGAKGVDIIKNVCVDDSGKELPPDKRPSICDDNSSDPNAPNPIYGQDGILTRAIEVLSIIAGIAAIFAIIFAGLKFATSQGDPSSVSTARQSLIYAIIGIVIVVVSQAVVKFVLVNL